MPSLNKQWSIERLGQEDYPMNFAGFSPFIRWAGPLVAKPGDLAMTRRGKYWSFVKAGVAHVTPTWTVGNLDVTAGADANGPLPISAIGTINTAGAGYRVGEVVPILNAAGVNAGASLKVSTVNTTGGITAAVLYAGGFASYVTGALNLAAPAAPFLKCAIADAFAGLTGAGTTYRYFAPFDIGEYGWVELI